LLNRVPINNTLSLTGMTLILGVFTGDVIGFMRTRLDDAQPSDDARFRIHDALRALLTAHLPPRAAKEWRDRRRTGHVVLCGMTGFLVWTEATRLYDLRKVIAALTAKDTLHVKRLDDGTWVDFLQLLKDTGLAWGRELLSGSAALSMSEIKCYQCWGFGHYARNCPNPRPPPYVLTRVAGCADTGPPTFVDGACLCEEIGSMSCTGRSQW
jgi:hypothetical protein